MAPERKPDMATAPTQQETVELLHAQREDCIACLNDIVTIHLEIDPPSRIIEADDDECFYRLRKVRLHVQAITGWQMESDVLHLIAPEFRCADNQLKKVFKSMPESFRVNYLGEHGTVAGHFRQRARELREIISSIVHPTPQRLLMSIERGGFYEKKVMPSLFFILWMLMDLALNYADSVAYLSKEPTIEIAPQLTPAYQRLTSVADALEHFPFDEIFGAGE